LQRRPVGQHVGSSSHDFGHSSAHQVGTQSAGFAKTEVAHSAGPTGTQVSLLKS